LKVESIYVCLYISLSVHPLMFVPETFAAANGFSSWETVASLACTKTLCVHNIFQSVL